MCASITIFWPAVKAAWSHVTVTEEIIVTSELRYDDAHTDDRKLGAERATSLKSNRSMEGLVAVENMQGKSFYFDTQSEPRVLQNLPLE